MSYSVLVVDDSPIIRSAVKRALEIAGVRVGALHEAADGRAALSILSTERVDIVFADLNMPGMGGADMVSQMARDGLLARVAVVVVSSDRSQARIDELKRQGVRGYIRKPFRPENFRDVVRELLTEGGSHGA
jgi:two-component system, chemotaxis family, chemotaxis protein CheY